MTQDEFKAKYGQDALSRLTSPMSAPEPTSFWDSVKGVPGNIKSSFESRADDVAVMQQEVKDGRIGQFEAGARALGAGGGAVWDTIGSIIAPALKPALETEEGKALVDALSRGEEGYEKIKNSSEGMRRTAEVIESFLNVATLFPAGSITKSAASGTIKGAKTVGEAAKTGVKVAGEAVGPATKATGGFLEKAGTALHGATPMFKSNIQEAGSVVKEAAGTAGGFVKRKIKDTADGLGLTGLTEKQIAVKAEKARNYLWKDVIGPALKKIEPKLSKDDLFTKIKNNLEGITDPSRRKAFLEGLDGIKADYKDVVEWSAKEAQDLKAALTKNIPAKAYKGKDIAGAANNIRKEMSDEIRRWIRENIDEAATLAYDDYGNILTIIDRGKSAITKAYLEGGSGKLVGRVVKDVVTPISTYGGKVLQKAGNILKK